MQTDHNVPTVHVISDVIGIGWGHNEIAAKRNAYSDALHQYARAVDEFTQSDLDSYKPFIFPEVEAKIEPVHGFSRFRRRPIIVSYICQYRMSYAIESRD